MSTQAADTPVRIQAHNDSQRRLGNWTTARSFQIRSRRGSVVMDLRSPRIPAGDIEIELDLDHATLKLLVADDAVIDQWDLSWSGRGRVKQTFHHDSDGTGRRIRLTGRVGGGEVRVSSGGIARLSAMLSREYLTDARRAHAEGGAPTLDDSARGD